MTRTLLLACLAGAASFSVGDVRIDANQVLVVRFHGSVSLSQSHRGDWIQATIENDRDLPKGTELGGRILGVEPGRDKQPGTIDMEFDTLRTPDGMRYAIRAVPVKLDRRYMNEDRNGRWTIKKSRPRSENVVFGTGAVGLILGSLVKRPFEGTLIGLLAGIVFNETGALENDVAIRDGDRIGAFFTESVTLSLDGTAYGRGGRGTDPWENPRGDRQPRQTTDRDVAIRCGDRMLVWQQGAEPYWDGDVLMVPVESIGEQIGLKVDRSTSGRSIFLETEDDAIKLDVDAETFRLNGRRTRLAKPVVVREGVVFAPIQAIASISPQDLFANGNKIDRQS